MIAVIFSTLVVAHFGGLGTTSAQSQALTDNGKTYYIEVNSSPLALTGNNNNLNIGTNTANIVITGNGNALQIGHNAGPIKYTGNGGIMRVGSQSGQQSVEYTGNNGVMEVVATSGSADFGSISSVPQYKIVGNGCCMKVPHNRVYCEIIGNDCSLKVQDNSGPVKYVGNGGHVLFGLESSVRTVNFIGNNGRQETVGYVGSC